MMNSHKHKEQLREQFLNQREALSLEEWARPSEIIIEQLKQLPVFKNAKVIHCYVSMNECHEVNTHPLIKEMLKKNKKIVVPVTNFKEGVLTHVELNSFDDLVLNRRGILEPENKKKVPVSDLDLVIVPMAGGDEFCNRIGYGAGFYDRFLKNISAPKVGLVFEQNIIKELPVEPFDIPLDKIVTEERVLSKGE